MERYRIVEDVGLYYVTFTVVEWLPVFIDDTACKIITDSFNYCIRWSMIGAGENTTMNDQNLLNRITIDPAMAFGKPAIRGLRYSVEWMLELLSSGMSTEEILADYKDLEKEDIQAVLLYAARLSQVKRMSLAAA